VSDLYKKKYTINPFDYDFSHRVRNVTLMYFLQDISTRHHSSKMAENNLSENKCIWVIVEWNVTFHSDVKEIETVFAQTEVVYFRKFIAYRRHELKDEEGNLLASAISKWAYIDENTKHQVNIPESYYVFFDVEKASKKPEKSNRLSDISCEGHKTLRTAVYSDIDANMHVNNVAYIKWVLDSVGMHQLNQMKPIHFNAFYKKEIQYKESVTIITQANEMRDHTMHKIYNAHDELCFEMSIDWQAI